MHFVCLWVGAHDADGVDVVEKGAGQVDFASTVDEFVDLFGEGVGGCQIGTDCAFGGVWEGGRE